eukprot:tig00021617_g22930.t1
MGIPVAGAYGYGMNPYGRMYDDDDGGGVANQWCCLCCCPCFIGNPCSPARNAGSVAAAIAMLLHPISLVALLGVFFMWYKLFGRGAEPAQPLILFGRAFTYREKLAACGAASVLLFFATGASSTFTWLLGTSCALVALHASFRVPPARPEEVEGRGAAESASPSVVMAVPQALARLDQ